MTLKVFSFSLVSSLLFIFTTCEPVDTINHEYDEEEKENYIEIIVEDWIEEGDSTVIELKPDA